MQQFLDTFAVFMANVLRLRPTSWQHAKKQAVDMRKANAEFTPSKVIVDGNEVEATRPESPYTYLGNNILSALGFVGVVWVVVQVVTAFWLAIPYILAIAVFGIILSQFGSTTPATKPAL